jgi:NhaA family Na+:H+ antiporter
VFLLSLAIVDDILAVLVIAAFYTAEIDLGSLTGALAGFGVIRLLNWSGVRTVPAYVIVGAVIWLFTLKSGVHPTVAGVALGLLTPASAWLGDRSFLEVLSRTTRRLERAGEDQHARHDALSAMSFASREAVSPLERLEVALHPWVGFAIMPIFALANAGVAVDSSTLSTPLALATALGLVIGKPLGICAGALAVVALGWARFPDGLRMRTLFAAGCLGGIGFTMSLFVASLGLSGDLLVEAKTGVLMGSGISMVLGLVLLHLWLPRNGGSEMPAMAELGVSPDRDPKPPC